MLSLILSSDLTHGASWLRTPICERLPANANAGGKAYGIVVQLARSAAPASYCHAASGRHCGSVPAQSQHRSHRRPSARWREDRGCQRHPVKANAGGKSRMLSACSARVTVLRWHKGRYCLWRALKEIGLRSQSGSRFRRHARFSRSRPIACVTGRLRPWANPRASVADQPMNNPKELRDSWPRDYARGFRLSIMSSSGSRDSRTTVEHP